MLLHIFINGQELLTGEVEPGQVSSMLEAIGKRWPALAEGGRVAVALDSERHNNVTYLLNRRVG